MIYRTENGDKGKENSINYNSSLKKKFVKKTYISYTTILNM